MSDKPGIYYYWGGSINYSNFIVDYEASEYVVDKSADAPNETYYIALGYRFSDYIVTVHTEEFKQINDNDFLAKVTNPILINTGQTIQSALGTRNMSINGITLRYNFHPSAALKIDYFSGDDERPNVGDFKFFSIGVDLIY
ncbi:hypothetical protein [Aliikangiella maris]|uniref:Porin n=2 Tax=Aliikangiella maris TaxID=3162458 RepID=A0ABV2BRY9_9GAMM